MREQGSRIKAHFAAAGTRSSASVLGAQRHWRRDEINQRGETSGTKKPPAACPQPQKLGTTGCKRGVME